jgi:CHRD domain
MESRRSRHALALLVLIGVLASVTTAHAIQVTYNVNATEAQEVPAPPSPSGGSATGTLIYDTVANTVTYNITATSMSGSVTAAHIHAYNNVGFTAPVKITFTQTAPGSGIFTGVAAYPDSAERNLLNSGLTYVNVHTSNNASGQVRDQIENLGVQLPGVSPVAVGALTLGLVGIGVLYARRRRVTAS